MVPSSSTKYVSGSTTRAASLLSSVWLRGDDPTEHSNTALPRRRLLSCTPTSHAPGPGTSVTLTCTARRVLSRTSYFILHTSYFILRATFSHPVPHQHPPTPLISEEPVTAGRCVRMRYRHERRWVPGILRSQVVDAPDCVRRRPELTDGEIIHIRGRPANIAAAAMYIAVVRPKVSPKAP